MTISASLYSNQDFSDLGLLSELTSSEGTYKFITEEALRRAGAHDRITSFRLVCEREPGGGAIILFRDSVFGRVGRVDSRYNAYLCLPEGHVADPLLEPQLNDATSNVLLVRGRVGEERCSVSGTELHLLPLIHMILSAMAREGLPAEVARAARIRLAPAPRFAPAQVLLAIDVDLFFRRLPILRDISGELSVYFAVGLNAAGDLRTVFTQFEFDADGFRPGRRRAEQGVRALLNNLEFQGSLERRLPVILTTPCAPLGPLAEVYLLPGNANRYTTTGTPYISTLGDDQITLVRVPRA